MYLLTGNHKRFIVLAAFIYFTAGIATGFHQHTHADGRHFDCPLCATGSLLSAGGTEDASAIAVYPGITRFFQPGETFPAAPSILPNHSPRAPPPAATV